MREKLRGKSPFQIEPSPHDGPLWHHLPVRRHQILAAKGRWVLTAAPDHREAFLRELHRREYASRRGHPTLLLDDFEVFIEKV